MNEQKQLARQRLAQAINSIEVRLKSAESRPTREEVEELKSQREADLKDIRTLREKIKMILENEQ